MFEFIVNFIRAYIQFVKDVWNLYKVGFYEFFWAFMYIFISRPSKEIKGENILITGTGSGIARDLALKLALMENTIVCVDINGPANDQTVKDIIEAGGKAVGFQANVANYNEVVDLHNKTMEAVGRVAYLFNVAGVVSGKLFMDLKPEDMARTMNVNVLAVMYVTQSYMRDMIELGYGHVCNISSVAGLFGTPKLTDYAASKFALMGLSESLRLEVSQENLPIDFTTVNPYFINTGMFAGVKSKWPLFMPMLEPGYVTKKIIQAVEHNRVIMITPRIFYYIMIAKAMTPDRLFVSINKFMGAFDVMHQFQGRAQSPPVGAASEDKKSE